MWQEDYERRLWIKYQPYCPPCGQKRENAIFDKVVWLFSSWRHNQANHRYTITLYQCYWRKLCDQNQKSENHDALAEQSRRKDLNKKYKWRKKWGLPKNRRRKLRTLIATKRISNKATNWKVAKLPFTVRSTAVSAIDTIVTGYCKDPFVRISIQPTDVVAQLCCRISDGHYPRAGWSPQCKKQWARMQSDDRQREQKMTSESFKVLPFDKSSAKHEAWFKWPCNLNHSVCWWKSGHGRLWCGNNKFSKHLLVVDLLEI